jgi:hypothetical protein
LRDLTPICDSDLRVHAENGKRRCQVPQVDITELSYFLAVVKLIYSLQSFLAENDDGPTNL